MNNITFLKEKIWTRSLLPELTVDPLELLVVADPAENMK